MSQQLYRGQLSGERRRFGSGAARSRRLAIAFLSAPVFMAASSPIRRTIATGRLSRTQASPSKVDPMTTSDPPPTPSSRDFPVEWYDSAPENHFWMTWRLKVILRHLHRLKIDDRAPLKGFDVGCGHGAVQRQLHSANSWTIDGCDLNETAISLNHGHNGNSFLYNIFDLRQDLIGVYDFVLLLDVIEHVQNSVEFLAAARLYLKPGGYVIINVPALPILYSEYDTAQGHMRRYTKDSLGAEISAAGLEVETITYWGLSLIPLLLLRKAALKFAKPEAVIRRGFVPPSALIDKILYLVMSAELAIAQDVPYGTSLLAIVREASP
jgi:SAM-dependent methyltransferase